MNFILALLLVALFLADVAQSKKMWGSRKKRNDVDEPVAPPSVKSSVLDSTRGRSGRARRYEPLNEPSPVDSSKFQEMFDLYMGSFEDLLDSEDFDDMVNPDAIRKMILQFPGASNVPELNQLLSMPELNDPVLFKATMREGLKLAKSSSAEVFSVLSDPSKVEELFGHLPQEAKELLSALRAGDLSGLKDLVINLPGLDATQRRLLLSLLDGNTDALEAEVQKVLQDETQVEAVRLQFLESPELAEAMGIPLELLRDPEQWAETMAKGASAIMGNAAGDAAAGGKIKASAGKHRAAAGSGMKGQAAVLRQLLKSFAQPAEEGLDEQLIGQSADAVEGAVPLTKRRFAGKAA